MKLEIHVQLTNFPVFLDKAAHQIKKPLNKQRKRYCLPLFRQITSLHLIFLFATSIPGISLIFLIIYLKT